MDYKKEAEKGEALFENGQIDKAESTFKSILQDDPKNYVTLNNLGVINNMRGCFEEAEKYFLKALSAKSDYLIAISNLADIYQKAKRWKETSRQLERYLEIDNHDHNIYNQLGVAYLEMGDFEKACVVLEKSLELNSGQETVKESLSMIKDKTKASRIEVCENPLNILFVQEAPCIRNYKMASALRARGHRVSLVYTKARLSQVYKGLSDDVYNECVKLENYRQLWDISGNYDIIHCHNEPDILTCAALAGDTPVVHDTHDLISLRANGDQNLAYFEGLANRGAAGRVYSTPYQMDEAKKLYGTNGNSLVYYNYASEPDLPRKYLPKLSDKDGQVHIVYEGGIGGNSHRDFLSLFIELANKGIHIHIYPTFYNQEIAQRFTAFNNIHYYQPLSPKQIMQEMTQYDFGIIPFNLDKGNKRFLDSTIANKLFEYLAAGLPVITSPLKTYIDFFQKNPVGITYNTTQDIIDNIPKLKEIASSVDFSKEIFTYEGEIEKIEDFYHKIIDSFSMSNDARGIEKNLEHSSAKCRKPININTHEPSTPYLHQQYTDTSSLDISTRIRLIIEDILPLLVNERHWATYHSEDIYMFFQNKIADDGHNISRQNIDDTLNNALQYPVEIRRILSIEPFVYPGFVSRLGSLSVKASQLPNFKTRAFDDILKHCLAWLADENFTGFISSSWYKNKHKYPGKEREFMFLLGENTELASFWFNLWQKDSEPKMAEKCKQSIYSTIEYLNENISSLVNFLFTNMNKTVAGLNPQLLNFASLTYHTSKQFNDEKLSDFHNKIQGLIINNLDQQLGKSNSGKDSEKATISYCSLLGHNLSLLDSLTQISENKQMVKKAKDISVQYLKYCEGLLSSYNFNTQLNYHETTLLFYYLKTIINYKDSLSPIRSNDNAQLLDKLIRSLRVSVNISDNGSEGWSSLYGYQQIDILDTLLDWSMWNGKDK